VAQPHVVRRKFTVEEYHLLARAGILREDDRVELIDGEVVEMSPVGSRHAGTVKRLLDRFLPLQVARRAVLSVQDPVRLGEFAEPQPDLALLRPRADFYAAAHPTPDDVFLLVKVAETSADYDRQVKLPLYARGSIAEVWLVDLEHDRIEVYQHPSPDGCRDARTVSRGQLLSPSAFPDLSLSADELLG